MVITIIKNSYIFGAKVQMEPPNELCEDVRSLLLPFAQSSPRAATMDIAQKKASLTSWV
jgi:hypothetical protein